MKSFLSKILKFQYGSKKQKLEDYYYDMRNNPKYLKYSIGEFTYGEPLILEWGENTTLKIGKFCSFAKDVTILLGGNHRGDWITTFPFSAFFDEFKHIPGHPATKGDVIIGNDVWIGTDSLILSGVNIGDGAIVGARSVVTKNVEPYAIVAGNPAKQIKTRFTDDVIEDLLKIEWWNWEIEEIKENMSLLLSSDVQKFIDKKIDR
jgi:acetyltransferase-like isoleucine patch superfamily enzyme